MIIVASRVAKIPMANTFSFVVTLCRVVSSSTCSFACEPLNVALIVNEFIPKVFNFSVAVKIFGIKTGKNSIKTQFNF